MQGASSLLVPISVFFLLPAAPELPGMCLMALSIVSAIAMAWTLGPLRLRRRIVLSKIFELSAALLLLVTGVSALSAEPRAGWTVRDWVEQDGLHGGAIRAFAQGRDHYLWIGTESGLVRFDGAEFHAYDGKQAPALAGRGVNALLAGSDATLWIGTEGGGLVGYRDGRFQTYPTADGYSNTFIRTICQDSRGRVWVGGDQGLFIVDGTHIQQVDGTGQVPQLFVRSIMQDRKGRIWVAGTRLLVLDGHSVHEYALPGGPNRNFIISIYEARDGRVWAGTVSGLYQVFEKGAFQHVPEIAGSIGMVRDVGGELWVATIGKGIFTRTGGRWSALSAGTAALTSKAVLTLFEDNEQNVWAGTAAGMLQLSRSAVTVFPFPGAEDSEFETVVPDRDGSIWASSSQLFQIQRSRISPYRIPGMPEIKARTVLRDRNGGLWIGTNGQGLIYQGNGSIRRYTTKDGLVNNFIRVLIQSRDGSLWIGTDGGVGHFIDGSFAKYATSSGLAYFSVTAILEDRDGEIWIGTSRGISHLRNLRFVHDQVTQAFRQEGVWSIYQDADGSLWFATTSGLHRFRGGKLTQFTTRQGLVSDTVFAILEDRNATMWLTSAGDISGYNRRELDRIAEGRAERTEPLFHIGANETGFAVLAKGTQPLGFLGADGSGWFASNRGPIRILASRVAKPKLGPVLISRVMAFGNELPLSSHITLSPGVPRVEIDYSLLQLRSQRDVRFQYLLEGFDNAWVDAGFRHRAYYTNLRAGTYRFRVRATEIGNPGAYTEATIVIEQKPHFYQTAWFLCISALLIAGAVWGALRFRLHQVRLRLGAVYAERERLAREMHDTVIQGCTGISALLEAFSRIYSNESQMRLDLIEHARKQARSTIDEARATIFTLRGQSGEIRDLRPHLQSIAEQLAAESPTSVTFLSKGEPFPICQAAMHEIAMIVREAIWNALQHARAQNVILRASFDSDTMELQVEDDGIGFDTLPPGEKPGRYGLTGMRQRAQRIGGRLEFSGADGAGAIATLKLRRRTIAAGCQGGLE